MAGMDILSVGKLVPVGTGVVCIFVYDSPLAHPTST